MRTISNDIYEAVIKSVSELSCEYAEARISTGQSTSIVLSGDQIDVMSSGEFIGGSFRVLDRGRWGFVSFNDIEGASSSGQRALQLARMMEPRKDAGIVTSKPIHLQHSIKMQKDLRKIPIDEKTHLINGYNSILKDSPFIQTTRSMYRDNHGTGMYCNSDGSRVEYEKAFCGVSFTAVARDGSVIQPYSDSFAGYGGFELAENQEERAEKALKTALDLLKAESLPGGSYDVIIDPRLAGVFVHEAFGHLSEADFVYENDRMKSLMVLGKQVGQENLNIIDDGTISGLSGYIPVDDEGVHPDKTYLVKNGILAGRLHSRETAYRMGEPLTGNARALTVLHQPIVRMTNTYIEEHNVSIDDMMDSLGDGLYVVDALGGQTNLEMFTFSAGYAQEVKKGKRGRLFKDIMLSGNVFKTLNNIAMIGNDRRMYGGLGGCGKRGQSPLPVSFGGPHVLIRDVLIGGAH